MFIQRKTAETGFARFTVAVDVQQMHSISGDIKGNCEIGCEPREMCECATAIKAALVRDYGQEPCLADIAVGYYHNNRNGLAGGRT